MQLTYYLYVVCMFMLASLVRYCFSFLHNQVFIKVVLFSFLQLSETPALTEVFVSTQWILFSRWGLIQDCVQK